MFRNKKKAQEEIERLKKQCTKMCAEEEALKQKFIEDYKKDPYITIRDYLLSQIKISEYYTFNGINNRSNLIILKLLMTLEYIFNKSS